VVGRELRIWRPHGEDHLAVGRRGRCGSGLNEAGVSMTIVFKSCIRKTKRRCVGAAWFSIKSVLFLTIFLCNIIILGVDGIRHSQARSIWCMGTGTEPPRRMTTMTKTGVALSSLYCGTKRSFLRSGHKSAFGEQKRRENQPSTLRTKNWTPWNGGLLKTQPSGSERCLGAAAKAVRIKTAALGRGNDLLRGQ
jgi:hypothetical protein